jgi:hypothetical protein
MAESRRGQTCRPIRKSSFFIFHAERASERRRARFPFPAVRGARCVGAACVMHHIHSGAWFLGRPPSLPTTDQPRMQVYRGCAVSPMCCTQTNAHETRIQARNRARRGAARGADRLPGDFARPPLQTCARVARRLKTSARIAPRTQAQLPWRGGGAWWRLQCGARKRAARALAHALL